MFKSIACFFKGHIPHYTQIAWEGFHKFQWATLSCRRCESEILTHRIPLQKGNLIWNTEELNKICEYEVAK